MYELIQYGNGFQFPSGSLIIQQFSSGILIHIQYDHSYDGYIIDWRWSRSKGMNEALPLEYNSETETMRLPSSMFKELLANKIVYIQCRATKDDQTLQSNVVSIKILQSLLQNSLVDPDDPTDITLITDIVSQKFNNDIVPLVEQITTNARQYRDEAKTSAEQAETTLNEVNETAIREKSTIIETATNETNKSCAAIETYKNDKEAELQQHVNEWKSEIDIQGNTIIENASEVLNQTKEQARNAQTSSTASDLSAQQSEQSKNTASQKASEASLSASNAKTSETNANTAMLNAQQAERNSKTNETNASNSATASAKSATASDTSSKLAATKASEALVSANNAKVSEDNSLKHANDAQMTADTVKSEADLMQYNADHVDMVERWSYNLSSTHKVEGHVISVDNSADYFLRNLKLCGQTEQLKTTGAQLANLPDVSGSSNGIEWNCSNGVVTVKGTASAISSSQHVHIAFNLLGLDNGKYFVSGNKSGIRVFVKRIINGVVNYISNLSFTKDGTETMLEIYLQVEKGVTVNETIYPMLNKGEAPLPWEPFTGGKASPNTLYQQSLIERQVKEITLNGSNLLDFKKGEYAKNITDNSFDIVATNEYDRIIKFRPNLIIGNDYVVNFDKSNSLSVGFFVHFKNGETLYTLINKPFKITKEVSNIGIYVSSENIGKSVTILNPRLNIGTVSLPFEPYKERKLTLPEPITLRGVPAISNGNVTIDGQRYISDTIENVNGQISLVQPNIKYVFDGSADEVWFQDVNDSGVPYFRTQVKRGVIRYINTPLLCNCGSRGFSKQNVCAIDNYDKFLFGGDDVFINISDVQALRTRLSTNNIEIVYQLETPIITPLPIDIQRKWRSLTSFDPSTTIQNDGNVYQIVEYADNVQEASAILEETKRLASETVISSGLSSASALQAHEDALKASASEIKANEYWNNAKAEAFNANKSATSALESKNVSQTNADLIINSADQITKNMQNIEYMKELGFSLGMLNSASGHTISVGDSARYFLKNFRVYGETNQNTTTGAQLYDVNGGKYNVDTKFKILDDRWVTLEFDNTQGTTTKYFNYWLKPNSLLTTNTEYNIATEIKSILNTSLYVTSVYQTDTEDQFVPQTATYTSTGVYVKNNMSKNSFSNSVMMLRSFAAIAAGKKGSITFRISVIKDTTVTPETFKYEQFTGGKASPNPLNPQPLIEKTVSEIMIHSYQLFDASKISSKTQGGATVTNNGDGSFTVSGSGNLTGEFYIELRIVHEHAVKLLKKGFLKYGADTITYPYISFVIRSGINQIVTLTQGKMFDINKEILDNVNIIISIYGGANNVIKQGTIKPMLYQDGDGTWEPYHEQKITLSNPITLRGIPATSGGNVTIDGQQYISDTIEVVDGQIGVASRVHKFLFNGNERWEKERENDNVFEVRLYNPETIGTKLYRCLCSHFGDIGDSKITVAYQHIYISFSKEIVKSLEEAIAFFKANSVSVLYELRNVVFTPLPEADQEAIKSLMSHSPSTVISNDGNAYMTTDYVIDAKGYIDKKIGELSATLLATI